MTATITVVQSRTVQSDSECVFHGYGTPLDISAEDVCFYVSFHYCVSPCPGELPGPGGKTEVRHPQCYVPSIIFSFFNRPLFLNLLFK